MRTAPPWVLLAAVAALAFGCGEEQEEPAAEPAAPVALRTSLGQLDCRDWEHADTATRADIVVEMQAFAAGPVTGEGISGTGPVLRSDQATELFENRCGPHYARGFVLYKLYFHAAALAGG